MKRLSTLFLTACFALAAFALTPPVNGVHDADLQQVNTIRAIEAQARSLSQETLIQDRASAPAKAPQGDDQVINIEAEITITEYYSYYKQWAITAVDTDDAGEREYAFYITYAATNAETPAGSFSTETVRADYSYLRDYSDFSEIYFTEITGTVTGDLRTGLDLTADVKGDNGKTYKVHAVLPGIPEVTNTIDIAATNLSFNERWLTYGAVDGLASNDAYSVTVGLSGILSDADYANSTFTTDYIELTVTDLATKQETEVKVAEANIVTAVADGDTTLTGFVLGYDGTQYNLTLSSSAPASTGVELAATIASLTVEEHLLTLEFLNEETGWIGAIVFQLGEDDLYLGKTFTENDLEVEIANELTGTEIGALSKAELTITEENDRTFIKGYLIEETGTQYNLDLATAEAAAPVDIIATNATFSIESGGLIISASNDTYTSIQLNLWLNGSADYIGKTFGAADLTILMCMGNDEFAYVQEPSEMEITITQVDNTTAAKGYILASDGTRYNIDLSYTQAVVSATYDLPFSRPVTVKVEDTGYTFQALDYAPVEGTPEGYEFVAFYLTLNASEFIGNFTNDDVNLNKTLLGYVDNEKVLETQILSIASVNNIAITLDETVTAYARINITAEVVTTDGVQYNVSAWFADGVLDKDAYPGAWEIDAVNINRTFTEEDDNVVASFHQSEYGNYATFEAEGTNELTGDADILVINFNVETMDQDIIIPAGEYPINDSFEYGTVDQGSVGQAGIYPSFYGFSTPTGGVYTPLFFLYDGKVVVTELEGGLLKLTVTATNSYGLPINITYTEVATETALDNTSADAPQARKIIAPNGQLQIIRGEHIYDATGAILK